MADPDDHRHCKVCGKVCGPDDSTCSDACAAKRTQILTTRRNYTYLMYGIIAFLIIIFLIPHL